MRELDCPLVGVVYEHPLHFHRIPCSQVGAGFGLWGTFGDSPTGLIRQSKHLVGVPEDSGDGWQDISPELLVSPELLPTAEGGVKITVIIGFVMEQVRGLFQFDFGKLPRF